MKWKRNDMILLGSISLIAIAFFLIYFLFPKETGSYVNIEVDGKITKTLPLDKDTTYLIKTKKYTNTLQIKNGFASIIEANCPDKLCVHQHKISKKGENLVCLPHKVIVSISTAKEDSNNDYDGVVK